MTNPLKALFVSFGITLAVGIVAIIVALIASTTGVDGDGIGAYAGGISQRFFTLLVSCLLVLFVVLFILVQRARKRTDVFK